MTDNKPRPHILFVDDDERTRKSDLVALFEPLEVTVQLRHPEEVLASDLQKAQMVVVDYFLSNWVERDAVESVARAPRDGLAVIASLRSTLLPPLEERHPGSVPVRPIAFALWSGHLSQATFELPDVVLPHVYSRENNLDWAFNRAELLKPPGAHQVHVLVSAVLELTNVWPRDRTPTKADLRSLLGLDVVLDWAIDAMEQVERCRPPLHELGERTHGMAIIRWLLHRILPYPTFLMDEAQLCVRLRVLSLETAQNALLNALEPYSYRGVLEGFLGRRWWRSGIEDWIFSSAIQGEVWDGKMSELGATTDLRFKQPVLTIGSGFERRKDPSELSRVVRVRPDDWPPYADDAYADAIEADSHPELKSIVDSADIHLLPDQRDSLGR